MTHPNEDPLVASARREAIVVFVIWAAALTYTVGYCYGNGYGRSIEDLTFVFGFPDWVFWGIIVPWGVCYLITFLFSYFFMQDYSLGDEAASGDPAAEEFDG